MKKLLLVLALSAVGSAHATPALVSFSGGSTFPSFNGTPITVGFEFATSDDLSVTQLGWFSTDGSIDSPHQVGIWDVGGTLLGSATVSAGAPDGTGFRYVAVAPILLAGGQQFFVGGLDTVPDNDNYVSGVAGLVTGAEISFLGAARSGSNSGFAFPSTVTASSGGRFGPNFLYDVVPDGTVPEPTSLALLGLGLAGLLKARRRA